jgi:hypothetical protein
VFRPKLTEIIICQNSENIEVIFEADRMLRADVFYVGNTNPEYYFFFSNIRLKLNLIYCF